MYEVLAREWQPLKVLEQPKIKAVEPPLYQVVLFNDDFTPMDFVVEVLQIFFDMSLERAQKVMFQIHTQGKAVCAIYPFDVAETKMMLVIDYAHQHEFPLMCDLQPCSMEKD